MTEEEYFEEYTVTKTVKDLDNKVSLGKFLVGVNILSALVMVPLALLEKNYIFKIGYSMAASISVASLWCSNGFLKQQKEDRELLMKYKNEKIINRDDEYESIRPMVDIQLTLEENRRIDELLEKDRSKRTSYEETMNFLNSKKR